MLYYFQLIVILFHFSAFYKFDTIWNSNIDFACMHADMHLILCRNSGGKGKDINFVNFIFIQFIR